MIDTSKIRETTQIDIAELAYKAASAFYKDPENVKRFEKWLEERRNNET